MKKEMTVIDLVKEYFPDADEKECEYIIWEKTAFPLDNVENIRKQLQNHKNERSLK